MVRSMRTLLAAIILILCAGASFVCGQGLRRAAAPKHASAKLDNRVSALPDSGIGGTSAETDTEADDVAPEETFKEVLRYVKGDYVDKVDDEKKLGFGAVKTMLAALDDPKTRFLDPAQRTKLIDQINGQYSGIGAAFTVVKQRKGDAKSGIDLRRLAIVAPAPGSPAERAGLQPGDIITEIDGKWVIAYDPRLDVDQLVGEDDDKQVTKAAKDAADKLAKGTSLPKALDILNDNSGKPVALTVERAGQPQPIKVTVTPEATSVRPVESKALDAKTTYLRVTQFNDRATEQFSAALTDSKRTAIILDLRNNVGGPITSRTNGALGSAISLVGKLSGTGNIGSILRRGGKVEPLTSAVPASGRYKVVVLVNGGTSNLAEVASLALKERAGASIVGSHTFGDSVYQKLVELRDGAGMTVTTGKLVSGKGLDFTTKGVQPDIVIESGAPKADDAVVQRALLLTAG